jgi:adenylate cyclase
MREFRDLNRRDDVYVAFLYSMRQIDAVSNKWIYVVDAEEEGSEDKSSVGELVQWEGKGTDGDEKQILGEAYVDSSFKQDTYGRWLTAYAPIKNSSGEIVSMIGVDLKATDVIATSNQLLLAGISTFLLVSCFGFFLALLLSRWVTLPLSKITDAVQKLGAGRLETRVHCAGCDEFSDVADSVNTLADSLQQRDALVGVLSRYVSGETANHLISENKLPSLVGTKKHVTILDLTVHNIEHLSEKLAPELIVEVLNDFFDNIVSTVFTHSGSIDRIHGGGMTAVFGAFVESEKQERNAVAAASEILAAIEAFNQRRSLNGDALRISIGVHSGSAVIGNIGPGSRVELSILGKSVEVTEHIDNLNSEYGTRALISETTWDKVQHDFSFTEIGDFSPDRNSKILRLFTLTGTSIPRAQAS